MIAAIKHARRPREVVRHAAIRLVEQGYSFRATARMLGVHPASVSAWAKAFREGGEQALADKPRPGRPSKLNAEQKQRLIQLLLEGPIAAGFQSQLWTLPMIQVLIRREFGVVYHVDHLGRFMRQLNWTPQKPVRRARERDEAEVQRFRQEIWPQLRERQKKGGTPVLSLHS